MLLSNLAAVARTSGLRVVECAGWSARGHGSFTAVETVVCHHTAGPAAGNMPSLNVVEHGRAGLPGPLCNLGLARDGTVYVVAAGYAYHAGVVRSNAYANNHAIGIEAEATGTAGWPPVQLDAYARLCAALCHSYGIPVARVLGHKEVCSPVGRKIDPNLDMRAFRVRVATALSALAVKETPDMTPDQIAAAPIEMLVGAKDVPTKVSLQTVLRDLEGTQDRHGAQLNRIEALLVALSKG